MGDDGKDGVIDVQTLMAGILALSRAPASRKLRAIFELCDEAGAGTLDIDVLFSVAQTLAKLATLANNGPVVTDHHLDDGGAMCAQQSEPVGKWRNDRAKTECGLKRNGEKFHRRHTGTAFG